MTEYMDKQTAADLLDNLIGMVEDTQENDYDTAIRMGIEALRAEVQPVRHGHWIESDTDGFVCSVCRNGYRNQPTLMGEPMFEYCPVCGARMDGEQNG